MTRSMQWLHDYGWRGIVGFISPPHGSVDHLEFLRIAPEGYAVVQTMTYGSNFEVRSDLVAPLISQLGDCAKALREARSDVVAQSGTPFSFASEGGLAFSLDLQKKIEDDIQVPYVMMGLALINALKASGYETVAVACTSYPDEIKEKYTSFLEAAGLRVMAMENWVDQGIFESPAVFKKVHTGRRLPMGYTFEAAKRVAKSAPTADCIVISGGGVPTLDLLQPLEEDVGIPVISSLSGMFWEIFTKLGAPVIEGRGTLLGSLSRS